MAVLVLNSLSEQLEDHMCLYGLPRVHVPLALSLAPAKMAANTPSPPAPTTFSVTPRTLFSHHQAVGLFKACPAPALAQTPRAQGRHHKTHWQLLFWVRLGQALRQRLCAL